MQTTNSKFLNKSAAKVKVSNAISQLSAFSFVAKSWQHEAVSANGLPVTLNSIRILGTFQFLKSDKVRHANLCKYLNIERAKHGKHFVHD
jgi:hypothetical protein